MKNTTTTAATVAKQAEAVTHQTTITETNTQQLAHIFALRTIKTLLTRGKAATTQAEASKQSEQAASGQSSADKMYVNLCADIAHITKYTNGKKAAEAVTVELSEAWQALTEANEATKQLEAQAMISKSKRKAIDIEAVREAASKSNYLLSDSYDIAQTAAMALWEHNGKSLDTVLNIETRTTKAGKKLETVVTVKLYVFRAITNYINEMRAARAQNAVCVDDYNGHEIIIDNDRRNSTSQWNLLTHYEVTTIKKALDKMKLSPKEKQVLNLRLKGFGAHREHPEAVEGVTPTKEIARALNVTQQTIQVYLKRIQAEAAKAAAVDYDLLKRILTEDREAETVYTKAAKALEAYDKGETAAETETAITLNGSAREVYLTALKEAEAVKIKAFRNTHRITTKIAKRLTH